MPDEFFDRQVEEDKQFLDYASAIIAAQSAEGLESLTSFKVLPLLIRTTTLTLSTHRVAPHDSILWYAGRASNMG